MTEKTILVFCAREQKATAHTLDIDGNGEIILTCTANVGTEEKSESCGRFIKLPKDTTSAELKTYIAAHQTANEGHITQESLDAKKAELMAGLDEINAGEPAAAQPVQPQE